MSSNITPIRQPPIAQQQDWWEPHPEHPIWPPQWSGHPCPPPCPPQPCPPQPSPPSCFSQIAKAQACFDQSQALYNLVSQVVMDIFTKNPGIIPPPAPGQGSGPIIGVTDGSNAQPGQVGEFVKGSSTQAYAGYPTATQWVPQSPLVLQPGDWDLWAYLELSTPVGGAAFWLAPVPVGISNNMEGQMFEAATVPTVEFVTVIGQNARASFTVPTLLAFGGNINNSTNSGIPAGSATLSVEARRRR